MGHFIFSLIGLKRILLIFFKSEKPQLVEDLGSLVGDSGLHGQCAWAWSARRWIERQVWCYNRKNRQTLSYCVETLKEFLSKPETLNPKPLNPKLTEIRLEGIEHMSGSSDPASGPQSLKPSCHGSEFHWALEYHT